MMTTATVCGFSDSSRDIPPTSTANFKAEERFLHKICIFFIEIAIGISYNEITKVKRLTILGRSSCGVKMYGQNVSQRRK